MAELDALDIRILNALQEDGRITTLELAERVGLSPTPCARRVKRLEDEGLIERYVTLLNPERLGIGLNVFVNVRLISQTKGAIDTFEKAIKGLPEVVECYLLTGEYDYLLHLRVADIAALRSFVRDQLIANESVGATHSSIALEQTKYTTALPLPVRGRPVAPRERRRKRA
ncbi:MAG TPA: Lrp/AsnC family transcriptional regulator [Stellaceae bacterium]|nr:Lrp/AsnC family transcriptional regulator [Stellaceae bacterium]